MTINYHSLSQFTNTPLLQQCTNIMYLFVTPYCSRTHQRLAPTDRIDYCIHVSVRLMGCPHIAKIFSGRPPVSTVQLFVMLPLRKITANHKLSPTSQCPEVHTSYVMWYSPPYLLMRSTTPGQILLVSATPPNAPSSRPRMPKDPSSEMVRPILYHHVNLSTNCLFDSCQRV